MEGLDSVSQDKDFSPDFICCCNFINDFILNYLIPQYIDDKKVEELEVKANDARELLIGV